MQHVFLVPGFFGFVDFGEMRYFGHVRRFLKRHLDDHGVEVALHEVDTLPTASLARRTARLQERVAENVKPGDHIHLVGHSSGGLDCRLFVSPGSRIGETPETTISLAGMVDTVTTVATPHFGTPSARRFDSAAGKPLLRLLSVMTVVLIRHGSLPLSGLLKVGKLVTRLETQLDDELGIEDELFDGLLGDLDDERRARLIQFFREVGDDQALLAQITPAAMELFNTTAGDRDGVRYASVVTRARRPGLHGVVRAGASPVAQTSNTLYVACHRLARMEHAPAPRSSLAPLLERWRDLDPTDNDAMVPTMSQPWGDVLAMVDADHLDVIGHFTGPEYDPPHYDWIRTGTGFQRAGFERTWSVVVDHILSA